MKNFFTKALFCVLMQVLVGLHLCYATYYYVDATGGSDANNGQSQTTAWKTINKVNLSPFLPGDFILFKRGETFRGNINFFASSAFPGEISNSSSGSNSGYITFGAYGTGNKPLLLGSISRKLTSDWVNVGTNLWRTSNVITMEGYAKDAGNIIFNNEASVGWKVANLSEVNSQGKFYSDLAQKTVTIYSASNPGSFYSNIEIALNKSNIAVWSKQYFIIENLDLRYSGKNGGDFGYVNNLIVRDCNFSYIGGAWWDASTIRLGNGVQFWDADNNCTVERCTFSQIYDVAISPQGTSNGYQVYNLYFKNNIIDKCEQSYEIWAHGTSTMHDVYFENNTCSNAGSGWSHVQRDNKNGCHILIYGWGSSTAYNNFIRNNIFSNAVTAGVMGMGWSDISTSKITINNNDWNGTVTNQFGQHQWSGNEYIAPILSNWSAYRSTSGQDANSITANPLLNADNSLQANSPCINAGATASNVTSDFIGTSRPQGSAYDIGAYEYIASGSANLALNKPVTASSVVSPYVAANAVDGNGSSFWASAYTNNEWIYVDLGASYNVNRVKITWETAYATAYQIQISSDASTWTTMKTITGNTTLVNDHTTGIAGTGRYIRMLGTTRATAWGYSIYELEVYANSAPLASSNSPVCAGAAINLSTPAVTGATYNWTGPNGFTSASQNPSIANATTAMGGTYSVTVTANGSTTAPGTTTLVVNAIPATPAAGSNSPVCAGATINLSTAAITGAAYSWIGPNGFTSAAQNPAIVNATAAMAGTYSLTVTTNGCTSTAGTTTVVVNTTPASPSAGSNSPVCTGATIDLSTAAVTGATYSWTGPNGFTSAAQNPAIANATAAMAGTYSLTVTANGCTSAAGTTSVVVNTTPSIPAASSNTPVTIGATINLSTAAVTGATYSWTGPNGFTSASQNPAIANATVAMAGTYSVTVTTNGCTSAAGTTSVVVNATSSNLALNRPVTASSVASSSPSYAAANAVDGNGSSFWASAYTNNEWIYVDLGATYDVNRVKITWEVAYATAYQIQISSNASTWTTLKTITGNASLVNDHTTGIAGTGRYIRMLGTTRATQWGYSIYELEVYGTLVSNLALNKPVTVSSVVISSPSYAAANAVDGNGSSFWASAYTNNEWIYVDLGATCDVNRVKITWETAYATAYQIQISSNASTWTTMKTITGNTSLVNDHTTGIAGTGRYIRMLGTTRATAWGYSIYELEVYGTTDSPSGRVAAILPLQENKQEQNLNVYPNPVTDILTVEAESGSHIIVFDIYGRGISSTESGNSVVNIDMSGLGSGIYFIKIQSQKASHIQKVVKQ